MVLKSSITEYGEHLVVLRGRCFGLRRNRNGFREFPKQDYEKKSKGCKRSQISLSKSQIRFLTVETTTLNGHFLLENFTVGEVRMLQKETPSNKIFRFSVDERLTFRFKYERSKYIKGHCWDKRTDTNDPSNLEGICVIRKEDLLAKIYQKKSA